MNCVRSLPARAGAGGQWVPRGAPGSVQAVFIAKLLPLFILYSVGRLCTDNKALQQPPPARPWGPPGGAAAGGRCRKRRARAPAGRRKRRSRARCGGGAAGPGHGGGRQPEPLRAESGGARRDPAAGGAAGPPETGTVRRGPARSTPPLRAAVTTRVHRAGVPHLEEAAGRAEPRGVPGAERERGHRQGAGAAPQAPGTAAAAAGGGGRQGHGEAVPGMAGSEEAGPGMAGSGEAGPGMAGSGEAVPGMAGSGEAGPGMAGSSPGRGEARRRPPSGCCRSLQPQQVNKHRAPGPAARLPSGRCRCLPPVSRAPGACGRADRSPERLGQQLPVSRRFFAVILPRTMPTSFSSGNHCCCCVYVAFAAWPKPVLWGDPRSVRSAVPVTLLAVFCRCVMSPRS